MELEPLMSNPWSAIMPGGIPFSPTGDDEADDWGFGAPGDPVGEASDPSLLPAGTPPAGIPLAGIPLAGIPAITLPAHDTTDDDDHDDDDDDDLDDDLDGEGEGEGETPGWDDWDDWDEPTTPTGVSPVLMPGQWGTIPTPGQQPSTVPTPTPVDLTPQPTPAQPTPQPTPQPPAPAATPVVPSPAATSLPVGPAPGQQTSAASLTPAPAAAAPAAAPAAAAPVDVRTESNWNATDPDDVDTGAGTPGPAFLLPGQWGTPPAPAEATTQTPTVQVPVVPAPVVPAPVVPAPVVPAPVVPAPVVPAPVVPVLTAQVEEGTVNTATGELLPASPAPTGTGPSTPETPETPRTVEDLLDGEDDWSDVEEVEAQVSAKAKAARDKERVTRANRPVAVTSRDIAVLQFLARYRMATYPQIASAFGISYAALRHRMPRLAKEGLVVRRAIGKSAYNVWLLTDTGTKLADMDLAVPTLSWATVAHTLGLVDIGIRFESLGEIVVTEREIRAADTRDQPSERMRDAMGVAGIDDGFEAAKARLYVVNMGDGTRQYAHIPDMVLARPPAPSGAPRSVAVELELSHKPAAQWKKILAAYKEAPHIGQVIYFTHQSKVRSGILSAAKEVGAEHMVRVRKFEPSEENVVPLPGR